MALADTDFTTADHSLTLRDGRKLGYSDLGDPEGTPLFYAHGMPGSRLEAWFFHRQARQHGFRIIAPDRPGIGASDYMAGRVLLDYPEDLAQLADALDIDRFVHVGWSSGGSRTLACARTMPERVRLAICLSGYTNFAEYPGGQSLLQATRWPGPQLARLSPRLLRLVVEVVVWFSRRHPGIYLRNARGMVSDEDRTILESLIADRLFQADQQVCLASGGRAIATDLLTELVDWGFSLKDVRVPVWIYQGGEDPFVPVDYARHLAHLLPDADYRLLPQSGHLYPLSAQFQQAFFESLRKALGPATG
jgi:pimeloyl-ACP methyl ester carboxylesterase